MGAVHQHTHRRCLTCYLIIENFRKTLKASSSSAPARRDANPTSSEPKLGACDDLCRVRCSAKLKVIDARADVKAGVDTAHTNLFAQVLNRKRERERERASGREKARASTGSPRASLHYIAVCIRMCVCTRVCACGK